MVRFNSDPGEAESHLRLTDIDDDEKDPCETTRSQHKLPLRTIIALTCGSAGLQVVWSSIFSNGTIYLRALELPDTTTALVWAAPAICGAFVQPVVGASSDVCTHRWGRRKPYIVYGALGTIISILALAWASSMGYWLTAVLYPTNSTGEDQIATGVVAVLSVCALSLAVQPLQCALRALILDVCPPEQQVQAQSWQARLSSIGQVVGCAAGLLYRPGNDSLGEISTFRILSVMAVLAVSMTATFTCLGVEETTFRPAHRNGGAGVRLHSVFCRLFQTFHEASWLVRRVLFIQFMAWMGWFNFLFYNTSYISGLYIDTPGVGVDSKLRGYIASLASLLFSCVALTASAILPAIVDRFMHSFAPTKLHRQSISSNTPMLLLLWSFSLGLSAALILLTFVTASFEVTTVLMAINGISWAVTSWIPFALIGQLTTKPNHTQNFEDTESDITPNSVSGGSIIGLHNFAISAPQILSAGICEMILLALRGTSDSFDAGWVLRAGGFPYLAAGCFALWTAIEVLRGI